jgi:hypothetical protein
LTLLRAEAARLWQLASQCEKLAAAVDSDNDRRELLDAALHCREAAAELEAEADASGE